MNSIIFSKIIETEKQAALITLPFKAAYGAAKIPFAIAGKGIDMGRGAVGAAGGLIGTHRKNSVNAIDMLGAKIRGGEWDPRQINNAQQQLNRTLGGTGYLGYVAGKD